MTLEHLRRGLRHKQKEREEIEDTIKGYLADILELRREMKE